MTIATVLTFIIGTLSGWIAAMFTSYFTEKGKNLATKEDVREITSKIEQVKAEVGVRLHIHQVRYKSEFEILLGLSQHLVAVRDSVQGLRPDISYGDPLDPEVQRTRMNRYIDAGKALYEYMEPRQPFFPAEIYATLKSLENVSWREFVQYKNNPKMEGEKYWDDAEKNSTQIGGLAAAALVQIRARAQRWETFDPVGG